VGNAVTIGDDPSFAIFYFDQSVLDRPSLVLELHQCINDTLIRYVLIMNTYITYRFCTDETITP
jgi:hypothetical protein